MMKKIVAVTLLTAVLALGGCSSLRAPGGGGAAATTGSGVVNFALGYQGAPYRYGGSSPAGFDCSGFVSYVYRSTLKLELPRSAEGMYSRGQSVEQSELQPGDLVFFNTLGRSLSHVGIYIGNGQFVHATSSGTKRVMVSALAESYWSKRYNGAKRVVDGKPDNLVAAM